MGTFFISQNAWEPLVRDLERAGHEIYTVRDSGLTGPGIGDHPDVYMCRVGNTLLIDDGIRTTPDIREAYEEALLAQAGDLTQAPVIPSSGGGRGCHMLFNMGSIGDVYPYDVPYNAAVTGRYFLHNTDYTGPALLDLARQEGLEIIRVEQGYTKCSCVVVDEQAIITADRGIARRVSAWNAMLEEEGAAGEALECLLIRPGFVELPGYDSGFLGGASGKKGTEILFNGDLRAHPDFAIIRDFIASRGCTPVWYEGYPLRDIGSIIYLD